MLCGCMRNTALSIRFKDLVVLTKRITIFCELIVFTFVDMC